VGWDATILGEPPWSPRERADRFAEFVELTDLLLREPETSFTGRFYSADGARTYPGCTQQPRIPLAVAATGRRAMQLAAKYADTWVTTGDRWSETLMSSAEGAAFVRKQMDTLEEACARVGRDPGSIARLALTGISLEPGLASADAFEETLGRYAGVGITDFVVHWPRPQSPFAGDSAAFEKICARLTPPPVPS
jgi:alkanesulfonate monooxygenase SsuD/methylene tetrahydromethanopterin reductase-like flavin-dependent oxidoreductase (luciferase family)